MIKKPKYIGKVLKNLDEHKYVIIAYTYEIYIYIYISREDFYFYVIYAIREDFIVLIRRHYFTTKLLVWFQITKVML